MTKVDERAFVPELDDDALRRLSEALDQEGVIAAMLIGSQGRREAGPLSDIDVAVWHERWDLQLADRGGGRGAEDQRGRPRRAQRCPTPAAASRDQGAVRLVERDHAQRVRFETRALLDYFDTEPLRLALKEGLKKRIKENRFGRR
jgi:hypothetical protein